MNFVDENEIMGGISVGCDQFDTMSDRYFEPLMGELSKTKKRPAPQAPPRQSMPRAPVVPPSPSIPPRDPGPAPQVPKKVLYMADDSQSVIMMFVTLVFVILITLVLLQIYHIKTITSIMHELIRAARPVQQL